MHFGFGRHLLEQAETADPSVDRDIQSGSQTVALTQPLRHPRKPLIQAGDDTSNISRFDFNLLSAVSKFTKLWRNKDGRHGGFRRGRIRNGEP